MAMSRFRIGDTVTVNSQYQGAGSNLIAVSCTVVAIDLLVDSWQITCALPDDTQCVCNESELTLVRN